MRIRILARPTETLASISPDQFDVGRIYEIRAHVACVYLARGWAEPFADEAVTKVLQQVPEPRVRIKALVLVFEDEPALRRLSQQLMTYRGYRVAVTKHGEEGIERLQQQCSGVTVLDLMPPAVPGCKFRAEELYLTHTRVAAVPVLLRADEDAATVASVRVDAMVVAKTPFDPEAVLQALA